MAPEMVRVERRIRCMHRYERLRPMLYRAAVGLANLCYRLDLALNRILGRF
jgi:hypothetical protein